jgi:adenosylcobinamide-GDP ribazoletransferase
MAAAAVIVAIAIVPTLGFWAAFVGAATVVAVGFSAALVFAGQIGGQTGDALGACQQCTMIAFLIVVTPFA